MFKEDFTPSAADVRKDFYRKMFEASNPRTSILSEPGSFGVSIFFFLVVTTKQLSSLSKVMQHQTQYPLKMLVLNCTYIYSNLVLKQL